MMLSQKDKKRLIKTLIAEKMLLFGDFTIKSGTKSPYFVNIGLFNTGKLINFLAGYYAKVIQKNFPDTTILYGDAYKGIPLVVATSLILYKKYGKNVGYLFNRKEKKMHGEAGNFVGYLPQKNNAEKIVIIDDVLTSGSSILNSIEALMSYQKQIKISLNVIGTLVTVDRNEANWTLFTEKINDIHQKYFNHQTNMVDKINMPTAFFSMKEVYYYGLQNKLFTDKIALKLKKHLQIKEKK